MRKVNKLFFVKLLLLTVVCGLWSISFAAVPHLINYQGRLTDSGGAPLNGSYNLTFRIYDAESAGNLLWQETHSAVVIEKGIFSIMLGSVTNLDLPFDKSYFLEIKVGDEVMSPRQRITSAGYAIRAENSEKLNGQDSLYYRNASNINSGMLSITQGGTGRSTKLSTAQAVGSTDIGTPSVETDMPDMAITITTYGTKLLCIFTAPAYYGGGNSHVYAKLYIDGTVKNMTHAGTGSGTTQISSDTMTIFWLETGLTPGAHAVKVTWWGGGGYGAGQRGASDGKRILTCIDLD